VALPKRHQAIVEGGSPRRGCLELALEPGAAPCIEDGNKEAAAVVSVVLPCFDSERFVAQALESMLRQTYRDLEILAIDDGSRDSTLRILQEYAERDARVRVLANPTNRGLIETLNRGVAEARGELIARMDADDVAAPERIERQVEVLVRRPEIGVVGTGIALVDEDGLLLGRRAPVRCVEPAGARFMALFATPLAHPTLLARAAVMKAHPYGVSPDSLHTEDYELFTRMLAAGVAFLNLNEQLVSLRVRRGGVSRHHERQQVANFVACARRYLAQTLDLRPDPGPHRVLVNRIDREVSAGDLEEGLRCLDLIEQRFLAREPQAAPEIRGIADEQRVDILLQAALKGAVGARLAAGPLALRYRSRLVSPRARRYLAGKLRRLAPA
jgi:glycosyltransferase involved in cell wall biosynthesis